MVIAPLGGFTGLARKLVGQRGILRALPGLGNHLGHGTGYLFQGTGLLCGSLRKRLAGVRDLDRAGRDLIAGHLNLAENLVEVVCHPLQSSTQLVSFRGQLHADIQVPPGDPVGQPCRCLQIGQHGIEIPSHHADFVPGVEIELLGRVEPAIGEGLD